MRLEGKVALVTGAGHGLGRTVAFRMAHEGARVIGLDIDEGNLKGTAAEIESIGGQFFAMLADVGIEAKVKELIAKVSERHARIDIVVNNAGIVSRKGILECTYEEWREVFRVNVDSIFLMCKYTMPVMQPRGGAIVNVSSLAAWLAVANRPAYCASKGAVSALTHQLAVDGAPFKIRVNAVAPGTMEDTGLFQSHPAVQADRAAVQQALFSHHPLFKGLGRICQTEDVARAVVFLASDEAAMITGVVLPVDGGRSAFDG